MISRHFGFVGVADAGLVGEVFAFTLMPTDLQLVFSPRGG
jgi:hypothetical protein